LSKKALMKFANIVNSGIDMFTKEGDCEDIRMGRTLGHSAIFVDCRDELEQQRFFPVNFNAYFTQSKKAKHRWFKDYVYHNVSHGNLQCCSDVPIVFHTIKPPKMYQLEYFSYNVHPFGLEKNITEILPRKLKINEIIKASDKHVLTPNFRNHTDYHNMTSSEIDE
jgi:hypothetical protein